MYSEGEYKDGYCCPVCKTQGMASNGFVVCRKCGEVSAPAQRRCILQLKSRQIRKWWGWQIKWEWVRVRGFYR
jgi:hypothetical protein